MKVGKNNHIPSDIPIFHHNLSKRNNNDDQIKDHVKILLDICKTCNLHILNGWTKGESFGKITYPSSLGISTIDYIIVSDDFTNSISQWNNPQYFSYHSQIVCWINIPPTTQSALKQCHKQKCLIYLNNFFGKETQMKLSLTHLNLTNINHDCQRLKKRNSTLPARESTLQLNNSLIY